MIDHLIGLAEQIGPGKEGSAAALRLKEDAATAAKIGAVDKEMVGKLNKLVGAVLTATGNAARKGAKAKIVSAVVESGEKSGKAGRRKKTPPTRKVKTIRKKRLPSNSQSRRKKIRSMPQSTLSENENETVNNAA